jgi:hypothetical protein
VRGRSESKGFCNLIIDPCFVITVTHSTILLYTLPSKRREKERAEAVGERRETLAPLLCNGL